MIEGRITATTTTTKVFRIYVFSICLDCTALSLAISEHTLWLLTSRGRIQCQENISLENPIGTRRTVLPGRFNSISGRQTKKNMFL